MRRYLLFLFSFLFLLFLGVVALAHDIDHLSKNRGGIRVITDASEIPFVADHYVLDEQLNWDGVFYEGQPINDCFTNPQVELNTGKTMRELVFDYGHERRNVVSSTLFLSGQVNRNYAYAVAQGKFGAKIPFYNYDPMTLGSDPYNSHLIPWYNLFAPGWGLPLFGADYLTIRYDYFLDAHREHPQHSYRIGFPQRSEGAFNYYDRIPMHPIADVCFWWAEGGVTFEYALDIARAHVLAGEHHNQSIRARILYLWFMEFLQVYN